MSDGKTEVPKGPDGNDLPAFSMDDVKKHNSKESCWLVIHGLVYDVTAYLGDHPGSSEPLVSNAGTDATLEFEDQDHSKFAKDKMKSFLIGYIEGYELPKGAKGGGNCVVA